MAGRKYTKTDLIDSIYDATGIERMDVKTVIDLMLQKLKDAIAAGDTVELRGFGTFEARARKGRARARNPRTGELVVVESHSVPYWKPGRELKREVWNLPPIAEALGDGVMGKGGTSSSGRTEGGA
jgi:integration host factor subunit beta